jgi:hypothetical protein
MAALPNWVPRVTCIGATRTFYYRDDDPTAATNDGARGRRPPHIWRTFRPASAQATGF